jgi:hypothetical protein
MVGLAAVSIVELRFRLPSETLLWRLGSESCLILYVVVTTGMGALLLSTALRGVSIASRRVGTA